MRPSFRCTLAVAGLLGLPAAAAHAAPSLQVLTSFNYNDGASPYGSLIADQAGNLYGTTYTGGASNACDNGGCGTVFKLSPPAPGQTAWTPTVLHSFNIGDGDSPLGTLSANASGDLYGTTAYGGLTGIGTVFKLLPPGTGHTSWTVSQLIAFNGPDGSQPYGAVIRDAVGNRYGTTYAGGTTTACYAGGPTGCGTVFKLAPPAVGKTAWTQTILTVLQHATGSNPTGSLIFDSAGNLYGTTNYGGGSAACAGGCGTVFRLAPPPKGQTAWAQTMLVSFNGADGSDPGGSLIADSGGNFYGTTATGGGSPACAGGCGTVFKLSRPAAGQSKWTETVLFAFDKTDGSLPEGDLIADSAGNLYVTAYFGGTSTACTGGCGTIVKLSPPAAGKTTWTPTVLANFNNANGAHPDGSLLADTAGNLYGTTVAGGASPNCQGGCGTVFKITP